MQPNKLNRHLCHYGGDFVKKAKVRSRVKAKTRTATKLARKGVTYTSRTKKITSKRYGKVPKTTKIMKQHGTRKSLKSDVKKRALPPGKRISKSGKKYTETRRNRSDVMKKTRGRTIYI